MQHEIKEWKEIHKDYERGALLLGNGASIAVNSQFDYTSLLDYLKKEKLFDDAISQLFKSFNTKDFELILRLLWQASKVNNALLIKDKTTYQAYHRVRENLIKAIRDIHPSYSTVLPQLGTINNFLKKFNTVISLNYDLIVYWAMMLRLDTGDGHYLKDCFKRHRFDDSLGDFKELEDKEELTTFVFYPHGNLALARNIFGEETKLKRRGDTELLDVIFNSWESGNVIPLFVSEGTKKQKIKDITRSHYLNTVYREVLPSLEGNLVIYGWGFGKQDFHLLEKIGAYRNINKVAVSVYNNDEEYCDKVIPILRKYLGKQIQIDFFHSHSSGAWNNE